jgi:6-methylsalicylic acid synthase
MADLTGPSVAGPRPEPIAVIGMGCRLPGGVTSPAEFWTMLLDGRDAVSEVPPERWEDYVQASPENAATLRGTTRAGSFLDDIAGFDAAFFGVVPREAELMDPQQRIMLEVVWEALEHAGIPPASLAGTDAGVYVGVGSDDYGRRLLEDIPRIEAWTGIGAAMCAVANRVSYALDLRGPSFAVDTACSASLVATHLACQALGAGETSVAIVGGVNIMAGPGLTVVLDEAGAISPDGRSKPFDAAADGYGRGEGCGVVVLKRLSDALAAGDRVLAVIRGSGVHQDGRTNGIMAPSGAAQANLLRHVYGTAGIAPDTVDYVEAHGTGTRAGDPIEAGALASTIGAGRAAGAPCLIGSVKSNIGHLEAGSGVASLIKTVLAIGHAQLPRSLHFTEPNPAINWAGAGLRVVTETTPWPATGRPRRAGVSGYGYGGTIAHLIVEQAPAVVGGPAPGEPAAMSAGGDAGGHGAGAGPDRPGGDAAPRAPWVFPVSAASEAGLRAHAQRLAEWLDGPGRAVPLASVGHTLAARRAALPQRAAVCAASREELTAQLRAVAAGDEPAGTSTGRPVPTEPGSVWVFSGHGSQWVGMGRELLVEEPAFAAVIDELGPVFAAELGVTPREALRTGAFPTVDLIQPMIFAMQLGLAAVWAERGLRPAAVIGHSVGEIAAAVTAGALDPQDAARLICRRSVLLRRVAGLGAMAMVDLPFAEVAAALAGRADVCAAIAAAPAATVVSGSAAAVAEVSAAWAARGRSVRPIRSDVAFHSPQMDPLLAGLVAAWDGMSSRSPSVPIYSTALDDPRSNVARDGRYWAANLRNPVRLAEAVQAAAADGYRVFLEVSSHPVVAHSVGETLAAAGIEDALVTGTLRRERPERATLAHQLGLLHCHGVPVDLAGQFPAGQLAELPTMTWLHVPYWRSAPTGAARPATQHDVDRHTLLGGRTAVTGSTPLWLWETALDRTCRPYPGDHPVRGVEIIPAAVLLTTFVTAAGEAAGTDVPPALADVALRVPVSVAAARQIQVSYQDGVVRLSSRLAGPEQGGDESWLTHTIAAAEPAAVPALGVVDVPALRARCPEVLPTNWVIERLASVGVAAMGFPWRIEQLRRNGADDLFAVVSADGSGMPRPPRSWAPVLDAALSIGSVLFSGAPLLRMPAAIARVSLGSAVPGRAMLHVRRASGPAGSDTVDVTVTDADGRVRAELTGLRYGVLDGDPGATASPHRLVHELVWQPLELAGASEPALAAAVVVGTGALAAAVRAGLAAGGVPVHEVDSAERIEQVRDRCAAGTAVVLVAEPAAGTDPGEAGVRAAWRLADTVRRVVGWSGERPVLWAVTTGARESATEAALGQAPVWGLGRIVAGEHPDRWGGLVDLDPADPGGAARWLPDLLRCRPGEDGFALDLTGVSASRLRPLAGEPTRPATACRPDATYLVTGGLGVLGLEVARWLAGRGARRIMLAGRHGLPPRSRWDSVAGPGAADIRRQVAAVRALEALGVTVAVVAADVSDPAAAAALDPAALGLPPIRGVVHAAGVLDSRLLADLDEASLRTVMRPKVAGALALHRMFPPGSLDFLALFSSCGYLLGLPGQASYGAANAFLDALAAHRRSAGADDTTSFGWTSWRGLGMSTSSALIDMELTARGTADISAVEAFRSWELASRYAVPQVAVLRVIPSDPGLPRLPLLRELVAAEEPAAEVATRPDWLDLAPAELAERVRVDIGALVGAEIRVPTEQLDPNRPLTEMGLDSVMTLVLRRRLEQKFRLNLPSTLLWDHPTVTAIAAYVLDLLAADPAVEAAGPAGPLAPVEVVVA